MTELTQLRTENGKLFDAGEDAKTGRPSYTLEARTGPIHYKEAYKDTDPWLDLDESYCEPGELKDIGRVLVRQYYTNKADAVFAWDYDNATSPDVTGFTLYTMPIETPAAVVKTDIPGGGIRSFKWVGFPDGQFIAYMTAYDRYGNESDQSEWLQVNKRTVKPPAPDSNQVSNATFVIMMQGE